VKERSVTGIDPLNWLAARYVRDRESNHEWPAACDGSEKSTALWQSVAMKKLVERAGMNVISALLADASQRPEALSLYHLSSGVTK
jgi:hypothetical protein